MNKQVANSFHSQSNENSHFEAFLKVEKFQGGSGGLSVRKVGAGFHSRASIPPIIESKPPNAVIMPDIDMPRISTNIPYAFAELGVVYIIIAPIIMIIPKIAKIPGIAPTPSVIGAITAPTMANTIPPRRTKIPPIKDMTNAATGLSSVCSLQTHIFILY